MRVLIVDDEELVLEFLERSLKLDKYIVDKASNGLDAYEKALKNNYDVVVLDVIMPMRNGLDVCRDLRKAGVHTPIIILTSRDSRESRIEGLDAGADDYLIKPFSYHELEARLRALSRRPRPMQPDILRVGPLSLDPAKKLILLDDEVLNLRPKEYALLGYLMRNAGKVISREDLLMNVWMIPASNASNRLEVCMYHIRGKVNAKGQILTTIRGYGYMVKAPQADEF